MGHVPREIRIHVDLLEHGRYVDLSIVSYRILMRLYIPGVPFTYCYPVIYMARSDPSTYKYPFWVNVAMYATLLSAYYVYVCNIDKTQLAR